MFAIESYYIILLYLYYAGFKQNLIFPSHDPLEKEMAIHPTILA